MEKSNKKMMGREEAGEVMATLQSAYPDARSGLDYNSPYQLLIATILSAQTTDKQVNKVTPTLFSRYPRPEDLALAELTEVEGIISSIGFYHSKARHIIQAAAILDQDFQGVVPADREKLMTLPGVGRKTANVVLANAFNQPAIAVDTHVFRVSNRIGLSDSRKVEDCEKDLYSLLDPSIWSQVNHLLITHGRRICKARNPLCSSCPVQNHCRWYREEIKQPLEEGKGQ